MKILNIPLVSILTWIFEPWR